ncbi:TIM barrel protein [Gracilibacillus sp. S3-1-1]|uniref:TIM barrel protein n=1 Tax=Gracilibacillus pellucidus TaxID=3095368 RepID=A0ACC6M0V4_9BACI|nr:TIM barrel protein [Gracilibacillus sp. S3-1-1]MDX8044574.1 TIM barrel protein [Gracilibacillus sp. S3-1-1]
MKLGLCSVTFREKSPLQIIRLAKKAGLEAIEWGADVHVIPEDDQLAETIGEQTREEGLVVSSYGSYYRLADYSGNEYDFTSILQTAQKLGAPAIRVWAGMRASADADPCYVQKVIEDARRIADLAADEGITVHLEYHEHTLTDTKESARKLMEKIDHPNLFLYWQPQNDVSVQERLASIELLKSWLTNIHVFHWYSFADRLELKQGEEEWLTYLQAINQNGANRYLLMEFVKGDDETEFLRDAQILHKWREML